jgi:hypothetical protein
MFLPQDINAEDTCIPMITRALDREQSDNWRWQGSSPYTSFYTYGAAGENDAEFGFWSALGKGYLEATKREAHDSGTEPALLFSAGGHYIGTFAGYGARWTGQGYPPFRVSVMFWKNTTNSTLTLNAQCNFSSNWNSGHDGSSLWVGKPNAVNKANVTDISWHSDTYSGSATNWGGSVSRSGIQPNETVIVLGMNSFYYHQDSSGVASWQDLHQMRNLYEIWNAGFRPDYDMYRTAILGQDTATADSYHVRAALVYRMCAHYFPSETP